jgi:uncharacterized protein YqjF (DUF2071 family)
MRQSWLDVSFLHWRYDPEIVRPLVPQGLELDLFDGAAWVGLIPFRIRGLTLPHAPPVPYLSNFPETNVRTYARDRTGGAGVWFFSLDAARLLAVAGARAIYGLPYFWSAMRVKCDGRTARYTSSRIQPTALSDVEVQIGERIADPDPLDLFLTMRLRLYAKRLGRLWKADVTHPPWPLRRATVTLCRDSLVSASGLPAPEGVALAHYAKRLNVLVGPPSPL